MMATTPNLGLYVIQPSELMTNVLDWVNQMSSTDSASNMMVLDAVIAALQSGKSNKIVESVDEPSGLNAGDEWDQILSEETPDFDYDTLSAWEGGDY